MLPTGLRRGSRSLRRRRGDLPTWEVHVEDARDQCEQDSTGESRNPRSLADPVLRCLLGNSLLIAVLDEWRHGPFDHPIQESPQLITHLPFPAPWEDCVTLSLGNQRKRRSTPGTRSTPALPSVTPSALRCASSASMTSTRHALLPREAPRKSKARRIAPGLLATHERMDLLFPASSSGPTTSMVAPAPRSRPSGRLAPQSWP